LTLELCQLHLVGSTGLTSLVLEPLSHRPWDDTKLMEDADAAFKRLEENSLFKELEIKVDPQWHLGGCLDYW
jgi:hypothetical protein